ncbi:MAG: hypothetical protein ACK55Z_07685 [bacterium]
MQNLPCGSNFDAGFPMTSILNSRQPLERFVQASNAASGVSVASSMMTITRSALIP